MTLTKAIEAAREAMNRVVVHWQTGESGRYWHQDIHLVQEAITALPDKPMTEDEIMQIIREAWNKGATGYGENLYDIFSALKSKNVLYVQETPISEPKGK